jgi:hypothetical protein
MLWGESEGGIECGRVDKGALEGSGGSVKVAMSERTEDSRLSFLYEVGFKDHENALRVLNYKLQALLNHLGLKIEQTYPEYKVSQK